MPPPRTNINMSKAVSYKNAKSALYMPFSETKRRKTAFQEAKTRFYMEKGLAQFAALSRSMHIFGYSKMQIIHILRHSRIVNKNIFSNPIDISSELVYNISDEVMI